MKKKLLSLLTGLLLSSGFIHAQCTMTIAPTVVYGTPGTYTIGATGPAMYIQLCSNVTMYDTLGSNQRKYYLMPGAHVIFKGGFNNFAFMQGNSSYTRIGTTGVTNYVYCETTAAVTGSLTNTTTCTAVSFPTIACTTTGLVDHSRSDLVSVFPNPATNYLVVKNDRATTLNGVLINALGKTEGTYTIENGRNAIDLTGLNEGIYFLMLTDKNKTVGYTKVVVAR